MISRAAERRQLKKMKKKVKDLTIEEFKALIDGSAGDAFERGHREGFDLGIKVVISALKRVFGFGDKRIDRLMEAMGRKEEQTRDDVYIGDSDDSSRSLEA